jgi:signal transduction histidine kinase
VSPAGSDVRQPSEETLAEKRGMEQKTCGVLGFWTGENSSLHRDEAWDFVPLTEAFLQSLLHKYPHGHVFNPGERARVISSMKDPRRTRGDEAKAKSRSSKKRTRNPKEIAEYAEAKAFLGMLPGARSVAFVPLWDSHRERWFAGSFAWTVQQTTRVLTRTEDLNYLAAFGNSIMAEVARLDAVGADRAKSDFISSISHELRSPLHGILASVEFLRDTAVDLFQHSMIDTIERCGRTLLDTIQHVLDFAKINYFTMPKWSGREKRGPGERPRGQPRSGMPSLSVDIDLSLVTEDVIESVFAGHEFQRNSSLVVAEEASGFPPEGLRRRGVKDRDGDTDPNKSGLKKGPLVVIIEIDWRSNWTFNTQSRALRRVLMNLFGNALKYTDLGWVKISLQSKDIDPTPSQPQQSIITISISDSGRGIVQEYMHSGIFTPFTQENPLNPGTGLGLSIVLQIVRSLGGTIDITSEQGVGTEVVVSLTLNQVPPTDPLALDREGEIIIKSVRKKTSGLTLGLVEFDVNPSIPESRAGDRKVEPEPSLFLQASIESAATHWFDMKIAAPQTWKASPPDIYIANE